MPKFKAELFKQLQAAARGELLARGSHVCQCPAGRRIQLQRSQTQQQMESGARLFHDSMQSSHVPMSSWPKDRSASASEAGRARFAGGFRPLLSTSPTSASCLQDTVWAGSACTQFEGGRIDAHLRCAAAGFRPLLSHPPAACEKRRPHPFAHSLETGQHRIGGTAALQRSSCLSACLQHTPALQRHLQR